MDRSYSEHDNYTQNQILQTSLEALNQQLKNAQEREIWLRAELEAERQRSRAWTSSPGESKGSLSITQFRLFYVIAVAGFFCLALFFVRPRFLPPHITSLLTAMIVLTLVFAFIYKNKESWQK